jgi:protein-arginine kinase
MQMTLKERVTMMNEIEKVCDTFQDDLKGEFYRIKNMLVKHKNSNSEVIFDDKLSREAYMQDTKIFKDWPYGRAIYASKDKCMRICLNHIDHLKIEATMSNNCDIFKTYDILCRAVKHLEKDLSFTKNECVGYTTSFVEQMGEFNIANVSIKVPYVIN